MYLLSLFPAARVGRDSTEFVKHGTGALSSCISLKNRSISVSLHVIANRKTQRRKAGRQEYKKRRKAGRQEYKKKKGRKTIIQKLGRQEDRNTKGREAGRQNT